MVPPGVVIKDGMGGRRFARSFSWSVATERLVNAIFDSRAFDSAQVAYNMLNPSAAVALPENYPAQD